MGDRYTHEQRRDPGQKRDTEETPEERDEAALRAQAQRQTAWNDYLRDLLDEDPRRVRAARQRRSRRSEKRPEQRQDDARADQTRSDPTQRS